MSVGAVAGFGVVHLQVVLAELAMEAKVTPVGHNWASPTACEMLKFSYCGRVGVSDRSTGVLLAIDGVSVQPKRGVAPRNGSAMAAWVDYDAVVWAMMVRGRRAPETAVGCHPEGDP